MSSRLSEIIHYGAVDGVTGSCHELRIGKNGVLVDCGLFQGQEASQGGASRNKLEIEFPINHIKALLVTHCHIDHVGRIPYLLAAGFKGPIICSKPTKELLPLVLKDAVQTAFTRNETLVKRFVEVIRERLVGVGYKEWYKVDLGQKNTSLDIRFRPAGHVLGSAYIECSITKGQKKQQVVFSGDLGATYAPLLPAPVPPYSSDILVLESTYGDRLHRGRKERRAELKKVVERCFADRGIIIIPSFSIGRTQELLYEFEQIIHQFGDERAHTKGDWKDVEIVIDSPLAKNFTEVYQTLKNYWDKEATRVIKEGRHPLSFEQMTTIGDHREHLATVKYLKKTARPTIVIAASGMCHGGRVVNYLKAALNDSRTDVIFTGYQARGTPGRAIQRYGPRGGYVEFDERRYNIKAQIHTLSGYSAHGDQRNLLNFVKRMHNKPEEIRLVHGDNEAKEVFKKVLEENFPQAEVIIPGR